MVHQIHQRLFSIPAHSLLNDHSSQPTTPILPVISKPLPQTNLGALSPWLCEQYRLTVQHVSERDLKALGKSLLHKGKEEEKITQQVESLWRLACSVRLYRESLAER